MASKLERALAYGKDASPAELVAAAVTTLRDTFDDVVVDVGEVVASIAPRYWRGPWSTGWPWNRTALRSPERREAPSE
jgi:hypothetical protein